MNTSTSLRLRTSCPTAKRVLSRRRPLALVIDDCDCVRNAMQMILRQGAELRVVTAETSEEALEMARQRKFDVVTSDINRSGMNGLEFLRVFKQAHPTTPVIIVSAAVGEVMRQAKWLRAFACLSKPFACPELVALVRAAIASKKLCRTAVLSRRLGRFTTAA